MEWYSMEQWRPDLVQEVGRAHSAKQRVSSCEAHKPVFDLVGMKLFPTPPKTPEGLASMFRIRSCLLKTRIQVRYF